MATAQSKNLYTTMLEAPLGSSSVNAAPNGFVPPKASELEAILDSYSAPAVQRMVEARGINSRKKSQAVRDLARLYYDERNVKAALARISPLALNALAYIKEHNGLVTIDVLRSILKQRAKAEEVDQLPAMLVGSGLALYVQQTGSERLFLNNYVKHELDRPSFYGVGISIYVPVPILELTAKVYDLANYLSTANLKPYQGQPSKLPVKANFEAFIADILTLSRYCEQNKVRVLQSGDMGKRDYVKLNEQLLVKENKELGATRKLNELGRLNLLWNVAVHLQLIIAKPDTVVQVSKVANSFYEMPYYQQLRLMISAWISSPFNEFVRIPTLNFFTTSPNNSDVPTTAQLEKGRSFVMTLFQNKLKNGQMTADWQDFSSLLTLVKESNLEFIISRTQPYSNYYSSYYNSRYEYYGHNTYSGFNSVLKPGEKNKAGYTTPSTLSVEDDWNLVEGEYLAELFTEPLAWLGVAELGCDAKNRPVAFRFTELGRAALLNEPSQQEKEAAQQAEQLMSAAPELTKPLLVQPNFDVMVLAPLQNLALLRQIDRFADQTSMGDVAMYHLTKDSILRGFRTGLNGPQILTILNENSRVPVAQNIQMSVEGWNTEFERVVMRPTTNLLEVPDVTWLDAWCEDPKYSKFIEKRLGPTFALLKGEPLEFDKLLQKLPNPANPRKKIEALFMDYNRLQAGTIKTAGEDQLFVKDGQADPYILYRLGQFADLVEWKPAMQGAVFKLSAEAGRRAQSLGLNYEQVRRFLTTLVGLIGSFSPAMNLALKGWLGYYSNDKVRGEPAITLQTSAALLNDIAIVPELAAAIIARPTQTTALIKAGGFEQLQSRLQEWGVRVEAPNLANELVATEELDTAGVTPLKRGRKSQVGDNSSNSMPADTNRKIVPISSEVTIEPTSDFNSVVSEFTPPGLSLNLDDASLTDMMQAFSSLLDDTYLDFNGEDELSSRRRRKGKKRVDQAVDEALAMEMMLEAAIYGLYQASPTERQEAVNILSMLGKPAARRMVELLYDPDPKVRYNACVVLGATGDAESVSHLKLVENDENRTGLGTVASAAQTAIEYIRRRLGMPK